VDEREWLTSTDPQAMLTFLRESGKLSDRKARLFAVACCRPFLPLLRDPRVGEALEVAEQFADGLAGDGERVAARKMAQQAAQVRGVVLRTTAPKWERRAASLAYYATARLAGEAAWNVPHLVREVAVWRAGGYNVRKRKYKRVTRESEESQAALLREIFGPLPLRPVTLPPSVQTWNDGLIQRLAEAAYQQRRLPSGQLDNARLAVLADALEEAGCQDQDILSHLRQPEADHVRGCFVLDLVLNKK
jgi:hypothetical protein